MKENRETFKDLGTTIKPTTLDLVLDEHQSSDIVQPLFDLALPVLPPLGLTLVYAASRLISCTSPDTPCGVFSDKSYQTLKALFRNIIFILVGQVGVKLFKHKHKKY